MDRKHERNHGAYKESGFLRTKKKNESNMTIWTSSKKKSSFYINKSN